MVEKTMQKFQQLAKDAQSNGDPVLVENYLQHADHYSRRLAELNERNRNSNKKVEEIIFDFKPDIVYVHNTWFKATLGIFKILNKNNINTTIKLHNFRYSCTRNYFASGHFGKDDICNACGLNKKSLGLFNKYFLDSAKPDIEKKSAEPKESYSSIALIT